MRTRHLFLWCDLETTGFEPEEGFVMEASFELCYPTGKPIVDATTVIQLPANFPDELVWENHHKTGLLAEARSPWSGAVPVADFDEKFAAKLGELKDKTGAELVLAGSSVHFDRRWIKVHMPSIEDLLSYRMIDVRSLLLTLGSVGTDVHLHQGQDKSVVHRAKADRDWAKGMFGKIQAMFEDTAKRIKIAKIEGQITALRMYAHWRDGEQFVGTTGTTLKHAISEARRGLPEGVEIDG